MAFETEDRDEIDLDAVAATVIAKHGDAAKAVRVLVGDNYKAREANRRLREAQPAKDDVVLKGDDVKKWAAYQALGSPEDVSATVKERDALKTADATRSRADKLGAVCEASGWDPKVVAKYLPAGVDVEVYEGRRNDGPATLARFTDAAGKVRTLDDFFAKEYPEVNFEKKAAEGETATRPRTPAGSPPRRQAVVEDRPAAKADEVPAVIRTLNIPGF